MKKRRLVPIDTWTPSHINSQVALRKDRYSHDGAEVEISIRLHGCDKHVVWHEFGYTRKDALFKMNKIIAALEAVKGDIEKVYDKQEAWVLAHPPKDRDSTSDMLEELMNA